MSAFSLREHLIKRGVTDEKGIRHHLSVAYNLITTVPELSVRRYNPRRPMHGVFEG